MRRFLKPISRLAVVALATTLAACSSPGGSQHTLIPDKSIYLTSAMKVSLGGLVGAAATGAAIYFIYDPLAPNWEIQEAKVAEDVYHLDLRMKRYHTGGAGESIQILKRRAAQLQREHGYAAYQLLEYTEGIDSKTLGAQRVAEGTIKLVQRMATPAATGAAVSN